MRAWQPHWWQDKKRGGNYPRQWPPATWSNPHQEPGMVPSQPLTPLCGDMGRETSVVPTAGDLAGRGQTALCRAAPSLREGRNKGSRAPCHKDRHSLSHRHLQAQLREHSHSKHHTCSQGREAEKPERSPSWAWLFPLFQYMGLPAAASALAESQGHHSKVGTGPTSPVKKQDMAVPALFSMTQLLCTV